MFGEGKGGVVEKPDPQAAGDVVVVKIHAVPMCTEYKGFIGGGTGERFGHEAAGEVVEVAQPGRVKVGDRVVVQPQSGCGKCSDVCSLGNIFIAPESTSHSAKPSVQKQLRRLTPSICTK